ncbi:hypothetical protein KA005_74500 [bacterium]|nr:hypothetical protein [bacterium]
MKIPIKVKNCTIHNRGCICREFKYEQMESALKIICIWSKHAVAFGHEHILRQELEYIEKKALKALNCLKGSENENSKISV